MLENGLNTGFSTYLLISRHNFLHRGVAKLGTIWAPETYVGHRLKISSLPFDSHILK